MTPRYPLKNSTAPVWINTELHRCTAMEEDVRYPLEDMRQGRGATNPVPRFSVLAGKPDEQQMEDDALDLFRLGLVGAVVVLAVLSALWGIAG